MRRRVFIQSAAAASAALGWPATRAFSAWRSPSPYRNLLVLVELKGGNDGLNTVVPFQQESYYALRPHLAVAREQVLQLDPRIGLHPSLQPLLALWQAGELAIVQGLGYPSPNLSHFRSIEIWDTASRADEYLEQGWLGRLFLQAQAPREFARDGVVVGGEDLGPLNGVGSRVLALADTEHFLQQARVAAPLEHPSHAALRNIAANERDIVQAAAGSNGGHVFLTQFPGTEFGGAIRTASQVIASQAGVTVIKLTLHGFDTHSNQAGTHARLLQVLADGLVALKHALVELGRWDSTLVMTYAEFGRQPRQNLSGGTDHGTAAAHFLAGGRIKGGLYGPVPALDRLDGNGNLPFAIDFRTLYATVLERWWSMDSANVLHGRFRALDVIRA
jgi:uncharacterized protein (DUF1501 family)